MADAKPEAKPLERDEILRAIERVVPPGLDPKDAFAAVMCSLERRLTRGEAIHVLAELPASVRRFIRTCAMHREEHAPKGDTRAFLEQVAAHLHRSAEEVEPIAREVLAVVQSRLSARAISHISRQLPADLQDFLAEARDQGTPPERR
ncbi:DUF2267 domain-containing protein [Sorangium sp. So ce693]|uniref:DUF2267 domain-containing protein n=1 Tax=Sorangium sp. So ce693 TaxID=3133318 RepID=UPI003F5F8E27